MSYDWQENYDKPKLPVNCQIMVVIMCVVVAVVVMAVVAPLPDKGREISIAARACWDQGLRAVMHNDGTIECRD